ncbi:XRE family transcriptional regulator [Hoeflea sp. TYP-13]|uniref:XRE family transcriptional regulator n=1 Tax=Hoeflea sp. TYP-13 TaxID=3230023 RepID=UPI0034C69B59
MTEQLKKIRKSRGLSQSDVANALGIDVANYNRLENQKVELTLSRMNQLADLLHCEPGDFITGISKTRMIHVRAHVEAGVYSESYEWEEGSWYDVAVPDDPQYRNYNLYGAETRGPSMNKRYPEGTVVVFTDTIETEQDIEVGKRYIVERERADGLREATIKTLIQDEAGNLWLMPESTDPRHQQPIEIGGANGDTVRIVGRVVYSVQRED